jgi:hypothetical protein
MFHALTPLGGNLLETTGQKITNVLWNRKRCYREILMAVNNKITVFWVVTPCSVVDT